MENWGKHRAAVRNRVWGASAWWLLAVGLPMGMGAGCAARVVSPRGAKVPTSMRVQTQIITPHSITSEKELLAEGEKAFQVGQWQKAREAFALLLAAEPSPGVSIRARFGLAASLEGLLLHEEARDTYLELVRTLPVESMSMRKALVKLVPLYAFFEAWEPMEKAGAALLLRKDLEPLDRVVALAARSLARIEQDPKQEAEALRDVLEGLDLVDTMRYGATGLLPVPVVMLRFTLAEVRRIRSERVQVLPVGDNFLSVLDLRAQTLLSAQDTFADAIRSVDPHWSAMSGYRIGEMYRTFHKDLMSIPPIQKAKTSKQKELFYGIMHLRYRVLLEKGLEMMNRTLALHDKLSPSFVWLQRAESARVDVIKTLEDEKATLATFSFSEAELQRALEMMEEKAHAHTQSTETPASSSGKR